MSSSSATSSWPRARVSSSSSCFFSVYFSCKALSPSAAAAAAAPSPPSPPFPTPPPPPPGVVVVVAAEAAAAGPPPPPSTLPPPAVRGWWECVSGLAEGVGAGPRSLSSLSSLSWRRPSALSCRIATIIRWIAGRAALYLEYLCALGRSPHNCRHCGIF